jgi:ubiquinone biosynthesis protein COQ4
MSKSSYFFSRVNRAGESGGGAFRGASCVWAAMEEFMLLQIINKAKLVHAYITAARDISRIDALLNAAEATESGQELANSPMFQRPEVRAFLASSTPPLVIDKAALSKLPEGTLGKGFVEFLDAQGIDPADLDRHFNDDAPERVKQHFRRTHDLWHLLTGFGTDPAGEVGVQGFYLAQNAGAVATMFLSLGFLNALLAAPDDVDRRAAALVRGWLLGKRAHHLFGVDWASLWSTPIADVRARLGLDLAAVDALLPRPNVFPSLGSQLN